MTTSSNEYFTHNTNHPKDFREQFIQKISATIEDAKFIKQNCVNRKSGFSRRRKLSFKHIILLLTQGLTRSLQRELNSFYQKIKEQDFPTQHVTKSAFTHARKKLNHSAFIELNRIGVESFYKNAPFRTWKGFRLLSIDGSTIVLPKHSTVKREFPETQFGKKADFPKSVARISMLYDVLNHITINASIDSFYTPELSMSYNHYGLIKPGEDLLILDRGYPSHKLMFELTQMGIHFCMRLSTGVWNMAKYLDKCGITDQIVQLQIKPKDFDLLKKYNTQSPSFSCRIIKIVLSDGTIEWLATSILEPGTIKKEDFAELYHYRWNIEEGYKLYKTRVKLEAFSGKTIHAIKQDFFSKVFMMTTTAILSSTVDQKIRSQQPTKKKHIYQINRTNALSLVKETISRVIISKLVQPFLKAFDTFLKQTVETVRPGRSFARRIIQKDPPAMCYKQL